MTELEMIRRAETYMKQLSMGSDPISGQELPEDSVLSQVRLARCFAFTADILHRLAEQGGLRAAGTSHKGRPPFVIPEGIDLTVLVTDEAVQITRLAQAVTDLCYPEGEGPKLNAVVVTNWLVHAGYLMEQTNASGKKNRMPAQKGAALGITVTEREGRDGTYLAVRYGPAAQRMILEHLPEMLAARRAEDAVAKQEAEQ